MSFYSGPAARRETDRETDGRWIEDIPALLPPSQFHRFGVYLN